MSIGSSVTSNPLKDVMPKDGPLEPRRYVMTRSGQEYRSITNFTTGPVGERRMHCDVWLFINVEVSEARTPSLSGTPPTEG